jgi:hypothetical protein
MLSSSLPSLLVQNTPVSRQPSWELYYEMLSAIQKMLVIINNVKTKLDEFLRPLGRDSSLQMSEEKRSEFVKALVSHLAFSADKLIKTVPDLDLLEPSSDSVLLRVLLNKETRCLQSIVFNFAELTQRTNNDELFGHEDIQSTSLELDELLAHLDQTIRLLQAPAGEGFPRMVEVLRNLDETQGTIIQLVQSTVGLNDSNSAEVQACLVKEAPEHFDRVIELVEEVRKKFPDRERLLKEMHGAVDFALQEVQGIALNITQDPVYAEEKVTSVLCAVDTSFFCISCDLQHNLFRYPPKIQVKPKELRELDIVSSVERTKSNSLPHMESTSIPPDSPNPEKGGKKKRRNFPNLPWKRGPSSKLSHSHASKVSTDTPKSESSSGIPLPSVSAIRGRGGASAQSLSKSRSLPNTGYPNDLQTEGDSEADTFLPSSSDGSATISLVTEEALVCSPKEVAQPRPRPKSIAFDSTIDTVSSEEKTESTFQSKRPKISRMVSKSRVFQLSEAPDASSAPEVELRQSIFQALKEEFSWFGEMFDKQHDTAKFRVETRLDELIKKQLISHGHRIRSMGSSEVPLAKPKDLNQFISRDVIASENWKGLFQSTTTILTPLEVPRVS